MRITTVVLVTAFLMALLAVFTYERTEPGVDGSAGKAGAVAASTLISQKEPKALSARIKGKNVVVTGEAFDDGAVILIDGIPQKTRNDSDPTTGLVAVKAGKKLARDQVVRIQVRNSNGLLSQELAFYTGCGS